MISVSTSVKAFKKCCPNFLTTVTNIWATLIVIEFLKKYSSMMEELELVIIKAEQWLGKQVLPPAPCFYYYYFIINTLQ